MNFAVENVLPQYLNTPLEVGFKLRTIKAMRESLDRLATMKKDYDSWFAAEKERINKQISYHEGLVEIYLTSTGEKTIKTPEGRATLTTRTSVTWPDADVLIAFSKSVGIETRLKEEADKKAITAYIKDTGSVPPGYLTHENTSLTLALTNGPVTNDDAVVSEEDYL